METTKLGERVVGGESETPLAIGSFFDFTICKHKQHIGPDACLFLVNISLYIQIQCLYFLVMSYTNIHWLLTLPVQLDSQGHLLFI